MPPRENVARLSCPVWLWALLPLLLAAALTIPLLDVDAFNGDEPASLLAAGVLSPGSFSLAFLRDNLHANQAQGWPLLLAVWGRIVGWSEPAVRALPCFAGLLTLALVYRLGRDFFAPTAGLFAALLLSASVFLLAYMVHARAFTLVALFTLLCLRCYWRIALHPRPSGRGAQAGLLLGAIGLLYSHYFCALFLPALGLFHLLFVPKNRRWWQPTILLALAALVATAQLPGLLQGMDFVAADEELQGLALSAPALLALFLRFLSNNLVDLSRTLGELLLFALLLLCAGVIVRHLRAGGRPGVLWFVFFVATATLALQVIANEALRVIKDSRIRYLMPLWPMTALLAGAGLWRLARRRTRLVTALLAFWLVHGAWLMLADEFRFETGFFFRSHIHHAYRELRGRVGPDDLLVLDYKTKWLDKRWLHRRMLGTPWAIVYQHREDPEDPLEKVRPVHADYPYVWLLYLTEHRADFAQIPVELGRALCERVQDKWGFTLEHYARHSVENCPDSLFRLTFDSGIRFTTPRIEVRNGLLRLDASFNSDDPYLLARYSLAVHVIDPRTDQRVAQGDTGVGPGYIASLRSEIDISALPAGEYELRVALYDWRTGARLHGRDLATGASGDMHTLQRFRLG